MARIHGGRGERSQQIGLTIVSAVHRMTMFQPCARERRRASPLPAAPIALTLLIALLLLSGCGSSSKPKTSSTRSETATQTTAPPAPSRTSTTVTSGPASVTVSGSLGGVTASMHPANHHPKVKAPWPISFRVARDGRPAHASVGYEYLFAGQVVARRSHYTFTGRFSDVFHWPATAVGYQLTFRAVIVSGKVTINLDYPVRVVA
jgi:hypothetical protein